MFLSAVPKENNCCLLKSQDTQKETHLLKEQEEFCVYLFSQQITGWILLRKTRSWMFASLPWSVPDPWYFASLFFTEDILLLPNSIRHVRWQAPISKCWGHVGCFPNENLRPGPSGCDNVLSSMTCVAAAWKEVRRDTDQPYDTTLTDISPQYNANPSSNQILLERIREKFQELRVTHRHPAFARLKLTRSVDKKVIFNSICEKKENKQLQ